MKYTSDGKPVNPEVPETTTKCSHCGARGVKLVRGKIYWEGKIIGRGEIGRKLDSTGISRKGAIGALIAIIIIVLIIAAIVNWVIHSGDKGRQTDKLLELGCDPKALNNYGVLIWSCPKWRGIDVNDPSTYMNQKP
ncbi:MAG: hypothetical protein WBQ16_03160 [Nitrososphaeraceae archaeon]